MGRPYSKLSPEERLTGRNTGVRRKPASRMDSPLAQAKQRLRSLNVRASKGLGQHFLVDHSVLNKIISAAELASTDTVIEVGPGLGILTGVLLETAERVIAVEVDSKLASSLEQTFSHVPRLTVLNADILDIDPATLAAFEKPSPNSARGYKVVANLPYYVASAIIRHFLESSFKPSLMVVMAQKEVAQSMVAEPGGMSLLSVGIQMYGKPSIVSYVPARSFHPRPKVDSAIVRIDVYPSPAVNVADVDNFFEVVKAGFSTPRKQLRNSLSIGLQLSTAETADILEEAGIDPKRRPQTLSLDEWAGVYSAFAGRSER